MSQDWAQGAYFDSGARWGFSVELFGIHVSSILSQIIRKEMTYEFDKKSEDTYLQYLIKAFKKNIENGLFKFIIVDCCNQSLVSFTEFYNIAKDAGYTVSFFFFVYLFCMFLNIFF